MGERQTWAEADAIWHEHVRDHGWKLSPASWPFRLWGIRHVRWLWLSWQVHQHAEAFAMMGIGLGSPNHRDLWVLYAIRRGWA